MKWTALLGAMCFVLAACGRESSPSPALAAAKAATVAAADPAPIWRGLLSDNPGEMDAALLALAGMDPAALRAARYTSAVVEGRAGVRTGEFVFELGVPPWTREWLDMLRAKLTAAEAPQERAGLLIRFDSLLAGVMESWRDLDSTRPFEHAAVLRMWANQELAKLGDAAAAYAPGVKAERLKVLGRRVSVNGFEEMEIP